MWVLGKGQGMLLITLIIKSSSFTTLLVNLGKEQRRHPTKTLLTKWGTKRLHFSVFSDKNIEQKLIQSPNKEMLQIFNFSLFFLQKTCETEVLRSWNYLLKSNRQGSTPIYPDLNFFFKWHYNMLTFQWQQKVFD